MIKESGWDTVLSSVLWMEIGGITYERYNSTKITWDRINGKSHKY